MATIKDVAREAQVSASAVSRVLNKDDSISVSPEVRARIFQAAHMLGYVSPRQRRSAEQKQKLTIGVADWRIIRPDRHNVRLGALSCLGRMMTEQYQVSFERLTYGQPAAVDGVIAFGAFSEAEMDYIRSLSYALVFVNSSIPDYEFDQIQIDFEKGEEELVNYLIDKKKYRTVGYIGGIYEDHDWRIGVHRLTGLQKLLSARGIYDDRLFHVGEMSRESGYELTRRAIEEDALAEAVLLGSDEVAQGALEAMEEAGIRIPKDTAVIIYQDIQTMESRWPSYTSIDMLPDYVWENALSLLLGRIGLKRTQAVSLTVPTHLHIGDTA